MRHIALVGNPNVGKSTLFNALTGLRQHTGNWPGKTVELAHGHYRYRGTEYHVTDLPGTYSLNSHSPEEAVAEEYLRRETESCAVVVCDATCLERSLILALQVLSCREHTVVCVNLMDEAQREGLQIDIRKLEALLGVPVVAVSASRAEGLDRLQETLRQSFDGFLPVMPRRMSEKSIQSHVHRAQEIAQSCILRTERQKKAGLTARLDGIFLHRVWGYAALLVLLFGVFWLTLQGANYPSEGLQWCFDRLGEWLMRLCRALKLPVTVCSALVDGVYGTAAQVVAVMLPPMAIFFPLFSLLEDFGYLPRVAFLLDFAFQGAGACGKQALTACMGLGCNVVGVTGCRIIRSPRERLVALLTNSLVPCNGRFPALLFLISLSFSGGNSLLGALALTACLFLCVSMTLLASRLLSGTVLRGKPSAFLLEMPPYRRPRIGQLLLRSLLDRTLFTLGRALAVAAPAGLAIWLLGNCSVGGVPLLSVLSGLLEPAGNLLGMSGGVLLAFLLGSPANELVLPVLFAVLTAGGAPGSTLAEALQSTGWSWQMSLCTLIFFLFHWPCVTTLLTVKKETGSRKWTALAALLPTALGACLCMLLNCVFSLLARG